MARASVLETIQLGVETTKGTLVAANRRIQSFDMDADPMIPTEVVRPQGWKSTTEITSQKEHTRCAIRGQLCYNTLAYLLSSLLEEATISTPAGNGVWTVTLTNATGGTFTLSFNGQTTSGLAYNAAASVIQTALEGLSTVGTGNVTVSGANGGPYTVTFGAALARTPLALTANGASLTGTSPTITSTSPTATATRRWLFKPDPTAADVFKTFTVEKGNGATGGRATYGFMSDLELQFQQRGADLRGEILAQEWADGVTMTGSPTDIAVKPVSPNTLDVYVGGTLLGLTKLADCYQASWAIRNRHAPVFVLDSDEPSFSDTVERPMEQTMSVVIEQDSVANGFMTDLRDKTTKFVRIVARGGNIETGYPYLIQITAPFKFRNPRRGDRDGVYAGTYDLEPIYDAGFGGSIEFVVHTGLSAL